MLFLSSASIVFSLLCGFFPKGFYHRSFFHAGMWTHPAVCFGHHSVLCMVGAMYLVGCCGCDVFAGVHNDAKPIQCHGGEVMC